jgi:hypothetical protein
VLLATFVGFVIAGFMRVVCARIAGVHSGVLSLWAGSREVVLRGATFYVYGYCLILVLLLQ